jgi:glycosyltransferase involved in cell wall biosynthesis
MEPIRILQVVTIMNRGGLETMLMNYYRQIDRSKIQFDFIVHRAEKGHYDDEIYDLGGQIYYMPQIRPGNYRLYFKMLKSFFNKNAYRVVHSHINENSSFVLRAAKEAGVPCRIIHSHISDLGIDIKLPFRLYARMNLKNYPSSYFACSKVAGQWLFGEKRANSEELTVLNNAINVNEFKYNKNIRVTLRNNLGVNDKLVIGHVGRFNKQKNHDFLIDIFKEIYDQNSNAILLLIGEGDLKSQIEKKVNKLGLSSAVRFLGVRSNISDLMQAMDIYLFPSFFEGLPVVMIEAQASGLRCVVSDTITREVDVTGRVEFINLKESPNVWAERVLSIPIDRQDTSELLRINGYDTLATAKWLTDFYLENSYSK